MGSVQLYWQKIFAKFHSGMKFLRRSYSSGWWFNPFEKYSSKWESSPNRGENKRYLKPPPSFQWSFFGKGGKDRKHCTHHRKTWSFSARRFFLAKLIICTQNIQNHPNKNLCFPISSSSPPPYPVSPFSPLEYGFNRCDVNLPYAYFLPVEIAARNSTVSCKRCGPEDFCLSWTLTVVQVGSSFQHKSFGGWKKSKISPETTS